MAKARCPQIIIAKFLRQYYNVNEEPAGIVALKSQSGTLSLQGLVSEMEIMEKNIWMILFIGLLILCIALTIFLVFNAGGLDSKREYKKLEEKYVDLARKHSALLQKVLELKAKLAQEPPDTGKEENDAKRLKQLETQVNEGQERIKLCQTTISDMTEDELRNEIVRLNILVNESSQK